MSDIVNHPTHYQQNTIHVEPIDITSRLPHPIASAFEYCIRAGKKEGVPEEIDLKKALFWLNHFHEMLRQGFECNPLNPTDLMLLRKFSNDLDFEFAYLLFCVKPKDGRSWESATRELINYVKRRLTIKELI